jgi:hypothetical protein
MNYKIKWVNLKKIILQLNTLIILIDSKLLIMEFKVNFIYNLIIISF